MEKKKERKTCLMCFQNKSSFPGSSDTCVYEAKVYVYFYFLHLYCNLRPDRRRHWATIVNWGTCESGLTRVTNKKLARSFQMHPDILLAVQLDNDVLCQKFIC